MFTALIEATIVPNGLAPLADVNANVPTHENKGVESFVYSETFVFFFS